LNDGIQDETESIAEKFSVDYLFTGQRNDSKKVWRCPGFAFNIGVQQYPSDIIVLSCAEMYHINNGLNNVLTPVLKDEMAIGTPIVYDDHGPLLQYLQQPGRFSLDKCISQVKQETEIRYKKQDPFLANPFMPYFLAVRRQRLLDIGGYDEDFTGRGADDNDLTERLLLLGCHYEHTQGEVAHIYHDTPVFEEIQKDSRYQYNVSLWKKRKGIIARNIGRKWGVL